MRVGIFGAGQAGVMVKNWLPAGSDVRCFIDNDAEKQGAALASLPILALRDAPELDQIVIAVRNQEAAAAIRKQIEEGGFRGEVLDLNDVRRVQDIRLAALRMAAGQMRAREVPGALAELGVYRGDFAAEINRLLPERPIYLFDTFTGFDSQDLERGQKAMDFSDTSVERVREALPHPSRAVFVTGHFPDSTRNSGLFRLNAHPGLPDTYALVSLDADLYKPTRAGLEYFWPRLGRGGMILIHDYTSTQFSGVRQAVDEYCAERGLFLVPLMDLHGTAVLIKQGC